MGSRDDENTEVSEGEQRRQAGSSVWKPALIQLKQATRPTATAGTAALRRRLRSSLMRGVELSDESDRGLTGFLSRLGNRRASEFPEPPSSVSPASAGEAPL